MSLEVAQKAFDAVKTYVAKSLQPISDRLSALEKTIADLPQPKDGKDGKDGENGKDADITAILSHIDQKIEELPKPQDGIDGRDGRDGVDGLDALDVDILPSINDAKSYPRGTYARHNGGLWKAYKNTDAMDGWECIVNGVASVDVEFDGLRNFKMKTLASDGSVLEKAFSIPSMVYKSVFKDGNEYDIGDTVTFAGSLWHCNTQTKEKPCTGSKVWTLAAKRGADGKDK